MIQVLRPLGEARQPALRQAAEVRRGQVAELREAQWHIVVPVEGFVGLAQFAIDDLAAELRDHELAGWVH